jgi:hypothetical protein
MMQTELKFFPENPFTEGTQNHRLWEYLRLHKAVTTKELHHNLQMDTARIRDMRKKKLVIECQSIPGETGNRIYKIV